jgi:hypothetical protein
VGAEEAGTAGDEDAFAGQGIGDSDPDKFAVVSVDAVTFEALLIHL